jgi:hypothetical protein
MHVNLKYRRIESFKRYAVNTRKLGLVGLSAHMLRINSFSIPFADPSEPISN